MNRTTLRPVQGTAVAVMMALLALVFLVGTGWAGLGPATTLQQPEPEPEPLDISVWISQTGSTDPARRLDSETLTAQLVIQSNLRDTSEVRDPNRFDVRLVDATGITVFGSGVLELPFGPNTEVLDVGGKDVFQGYIGHVQAEKQNLTDAVARAISRASGDQPSSSRVRAAIQDALGVGNRLGDGLERLRAFDLSQDDGADTAFLEAQTDLGTASDRGNEALDLLNANPINWDGVRAKLQAMQTAANDAGTQIDTGVAAVNLDAERGFPPTGVTGRCNQNRVQLYEAATGQLSADFWWTVGTPGDPARLTNPEEPSAQGHLQSEYGQIYSTMVDVPGKPHSALIEALVLDALCLPVPGVYVDFSTPAGSIITLEQVQPTTDTNGVAKVTARATDQLGEDGSATVDASVGPMEASARVTVVGPPDLVRFETGQIGPRVPNYGMLSRRLITVRVTDANGRGVAEGTPVEFAIDPPGHTFIDTGGPQATATTLTDGRAGSYLLLGTATGEYTITAESGQARGEQQIQVVGFPAQIEITAEPVVIRVDSPLADRRSSILTVTVTDSEGRPAPDDTILEFELVNPEDADWLGIQIPPDPDDGRLYSSILDGQATVRVIGSPTWYREVAVRVTASYVALEDVYEISSEITLILRGKTIFLPLIRR